MTTRPATSADWDAIAVLIRSFPDQLVQDHLPDPDEFFVAEESGAIVGCCALEVYSKRLAEVRSLAVHPDHQGKDIAKALVEKCLERAKELGVYEVLTITGANSLFEKFGFHSFKNEKYALFKVLE
jgi:N-acetylglutamate synthase-like GNAT family acetyltransferase